MEKREAGGHRKETSSKTEAIDREMSNCGEDNSRYSICAEKYCDERISEVFRK